MEMFLELCFGAFVPLMLSPSLPPPAPYFSNCCKKNLQVKEEGGPSMGKGYLEGRGANMPLN